MHFMKISNNEGSTIIEDYEVKSARKIKSCRANKSPCPNYPARITIRIWDNENRMKRFFGLVSSGRPGWLMLLVAIAAINRPGAIGLEGNLTCLSALCTGRIVHLSWASVEAASASASVSLHLFHLPLASIP